MQDKNTNRTQRFYFSVLHGHPNFGRFSLQRFAHSDKPILGAKRKGLTFVVPVTSLN